ADESRPLIGHRMGNSLDRVKFFRRRQFVLGTQPANYHGWKHLKIDDQYVLTVHPDLAVTAIADGEDTIVTLGYMIDPYNATLDDREITRQIFAATRSTHIAGVIDSIEKLSGRFALIVKRSKDLWVFHDAVGLR